jgi:hypothetical protein
MSMAEPRDGQAAGSGGADPLTLEETTRLTDFARAFKAAARAVLLYPDGHPAIKATLGRIAQVTSADALSGPMRLTVLPDGVQLEGRVPKRHDQALTELAALLHDHVVGELVIHPGGDADAWRSFLRLLGRSPDAVRAEGGIARLWATMPGGHLEVREIDYAEVLRERKGGRSPLWEQIVSGSLSGAVLDMNDEAIQEFFELTGNTEALADLMTAIESQAEASGGASAKAVALMHMLQAMVSMVSKRRPEQVEPVLRNLAGAAGALSAETLLSLLGEQSAAPDSGDSQLIGAIVGRMSDRTIAKFVTRNVEAEGGATDRLAQAFQALVRDSEERQRLLALAKDDAAGSPLGSVEGFEAVWDSVAQKLLTSYSDKSFVSDEYGRELSGARTQAVEIERVSDDPPDRIATWHGSVATTELRALDLTLLLDLLAIEDDDLKWSTLTTPVVSLIEDLLLVGDFDAAGRLLEVLVREAGGEASKPRRQAALTAIDSLVAGAMMHHIVSHLAGLDDETFERVKTMCVSVGEVFVRPLAEALSAQERGRTHQRLTVILLAFGAVGRRTAERLKGSPNPAVRSTAIHLLRQFGGTEALPDLTELLDDSEPRVQREAVRAILNIATDRAYQVLEQALATGTPRTRDAIMQAIGLARDERVTPLFVYMLRHVDHRRLSAVYVRTIESLGALRDPAAVEPLKEALYKGEWWAPRRTAALRSAAAMALARTGTVEARAVLEEAVRSGSRGIRTAARSSLAGMGHHRASRRQA